VRGLVAAKPLEPSKLACRGTKFHGVRGGWRKGASRRSAPFDGSRVGSYSGGVFTGSAAGRPWRQGDAWANAKGFASRCIREGATGTTPILSMTNAKEEYALTLEREANAKASIHRSHHGGVKPLGARSLVRREATPPGQGAQTEAEKVRRRETRSRRRTNEARVLEIEAVDGRSRSHASRDWSAHHRKVAGVNQALVESLRGTTA